MQEGYFKTAWNDVKNTPGWLSKMFLLALIACIPIFGQIVVTGYLYGWARDIAWGVRGPMPKHIFGNEDGRLYSRGFFIFVLGIVLALLPGILYGISIVLSSLGAAGAYYGSGRGAWVFFGFFSLVVSLVHIVLIVVVSFFQEVGSMRISIYGQLSAGFQFKKIWAMMRKDTVGLLKIFGMVLLLGLILAAIATIVFSLIFGILLAAAFGSFAASFPLSYGGHIDSNLVVSIFAFGGVVIILLMAASYLVMVPGMWISALMVRALGYWTRQFDVPAWRGQEDPMPFELQQPASPQPQAPYQQNYQQQVPPQTYGQQASPQPYGQQAPQRSYGQPAVQPTPQAQVHQDNNVQYSTEQASQPAEEQTSLPEQQSQQEQDGEKH